MGDPIFNESFITGVMLGMLQGGVAWLLIREMSDRWSLALTLAAALIVHVVAGAAWMAQHGAETEPTTALFVASWLSASLLSVCSLCAVRLTRL